MAKRNVFLQVGNGADDQAAAGGTIDIQPFYAHADGSTWIFGSAKTYFITSPASSVSLTVGQYYWFYPRNPQGTPMLAQIPVGGGDILYKDLVAVDPDSLLPLADPGPAWVTALEDVQDYVDASLAAFTSLEYQGVWNAATNTPTLADGTGTSGDFYQVNIAGTQDLGSGAIVWAVGDFVEYSGGIWTRVPNPPPSPTPWSIDIDAMLPAATHTTWNTIAVDATAIHCGFVITTLQHSIIGWDVVLDAGLWDISALLTTANVMADLTVKLDGVTVGVLSGYTSGTQNNQIRTVTGVAVAVAGKKRLTFHTDTKNASSGAYWAFLSAVGLRRTA